MLTKRERGMGMKRSLKSVIALSAASVLAIGSLSGCAAQPAATPAASGESAAAATQEAAPAASGDVTELTFWSLFTGDDGATMDGIVAKFNEEHPDINVTHMIMSATDDLYVKLPLVAGDAKQAPDIAVIWSTYIPYFVEKGAIQPASEILDPFENLKEENFTTPELVRYKGERYGAMLDFPSVTLWANTDLVEKYDPGILEDGIITWDEAFEIGEKIKEAGDAENVKVLACDWDTNDIEQSMLENGFNYTDDGVTLKLTEDDVKKMIEPYKKLNDEGMFMPEGSDAFGMFAQGAAVFCSGGTWSLNTVKEMPFGWVEIPPIQIDPENAITNAVAHTFVLPTQEYTDAEKTAIGTFISWFEDNAMMWAQAGSIVANKAVSESEEFKALPQYTVSSKMKPAAPNYIYISIAEDTIHKYGWQAVYGQMSVDDYATAIISEIQSQTAAQ